VLKKNILFESLRALQIGSILGEKLLAFMPQMKLEDVTSAFFKMQ